jgi:hypothetical protein
LQPTTRPGGGTSTNNADGQLTSNNASIDSLARSIERLMRRPIVNETGLRDRFGNPSAFRSCESPERCRFP